MCSSSLSNLLVKTLINFLTSISSLLEELYKAIEQYKSFSKYDLFNFLSCLSSESSSFNNVVFAAS